jgi:hypothetical protein
MRDFLVFKEMKINCLYRTTISKGENSSRKGYLLVRDFG